MKKILICAIILTVFTTRAFSGTGLDLDVRAGLNIGGTTPLPFPAEIREIKSYNPLLLPSLEAGAMYSLTDRWGVRTALRVEMKGMKTSAIVKNYKMTITGDDGNSLSGYWTGADDTRHRNTLLTIPLTASYKLSEKFRIFAGPYVSFLLVSKFDGQVYDGYLRKDTPTGDKIAYYDGATSDYDFSDNQRKVQMGVSVSADYSIGKNYLLALSLNWGLNNTFESSFHTISFKMYPIYGCLAFGYRF